MATATTATRLLSRNEAATLSGVSLNAVNKAVEQRVVRPSRTKQGKTLLAAEDAVALALFSRVPGSLPVAFKREIRDWVVTLSPKDAGEEFALSEAMTVSFTKELAQVGRRVDKYVKLREKYIEINPSVMAGTPVIRGTRVPVRTLAKLVDGGESREALAEDYPHIPQDAYEVAVLWAKGNPRRGRPASKQQQPDGRGPTAPRSGRSVDARTAGARPAKMTSRGTSSSRSHRTAQA